MSLVLFRYLFPFVDFPRKAGRLQFDGLRVAVQIWATVFSSKGARSSTSGWERLNSARL